jgi:Fur family transcriptional regulator, peroxide stress response regulator
MIPNKKPVRRRSLQRERILEIIRGSTDHPSAYMVYTLLKEEMPAVSLGNVYRNIRILTEEGRLARRDFGDGIEHFDAVLTPHYHFICEKCGKVEDFPLPVQEDIVQSAQKQTCHTILGHTIQFTGICKECRQISTKSS